MNHWPKLECRYNNSSDTDNSSEYFEFIELGFVLIVI
jgi:hypothetical protein